MESVTFTSSPWSEVRDRRPWPALVRGAFHPAYLGIGEAYQGVGDIEEKIASMSRYPAHLLACTAWAGADLVGLLIGSLDGTRVVISDLFVSPAFQRRGIGRRLVEMAASRGTAIMAGVNRDNGASQALFESMGFRRRSCDWFEARPG